MSTVRLGEPNKRRLRKLQAAWAAARGEEPTQEEVLARALELAERHRDEFVYAGAGRKRTEAEVRAALERLERVAGDHGNLSSEIDRVVYDQD